MLDKSFKGSSKYWGWILGLLAIIGIGFGFYLSQLNVGLGVTGLSRDVSWGLYIAQLTFLVGIAASAVTVVAPYYLHDAKSFGRITIFGEFLAIAAVLMCLLFVIVDLGKPARLFNIIFHPTPGSILFWDMVVLSGYLILNLIIGWNVLEAERNHVSPPKWLKNLVYLSIPWAISIHTVTAFLYAGLPGRGYWLTALMGARFLASAFASGPALLILLSFVIKKYSRFDVGKEAVGKLSVIMTYALGISLFLVGLEFFTAFYSQVPGHMHSLVYLFAGLDGYNALVPFMWAFLVLAIFAFVLLINPRTRKKEHNLILACVSIFVAMFLEKGLGLVVAGFIPNPLGQVVEYTPTFPEIAITVAIWAVGLLIITLLYKMAVTVKEEVEF